MKLLLVFLFTARLVPAVPANDVFDWNVTLVKPLRDQHGRLHVDAEGIAFRSDDGKTLVKVAMQDLRQADVADSRKLRFGLYEVRKWAPTERTEYTFRAEPDAPVEILAAFLSGRVHRPVVGQYQTGTTFRVGAFHRRALRGTDGTLEIGEIAIRYVSTQMADSRTWLYRDIETVGKPDSFRLRLTTNRETYVLELKDDLPDEAFQLAWGRVYDRR
jgi:hypothetical protein